MRGLHGAAQHGAVAENDFRIVRIGGRVGTAPPAGRARADADAADDADDAVGDAGVADAADADGKPGVAGQAGQRVG